MVLKLIEMFLYKNSPVIIENLVYRFLNKRICKNYDIDTVKKAIRKSNPRQKLINDVKEMHFLTEESLDEYTV